MLYTALSLSRRPLFLSVRLARLATRFFVAAAALPLSASVAPAWAGPALNNELHVTDYRLRTFRSDVATVRGERVPYVSKVERATVRDGRDRPVGTVYLTEYLKQVPLHRPILFIFNGGPGSASAYLQLGMFGPRLVDLPVDPREPFGPPYRMSANPDLLLDQADLVFIDPVGTGFSRVLDQSSRTKVWSSSGDAAYNADLIRTWLGTNGRSGDPFYIVGESYGAERAVNVGDRLTCGEAAPSCKPLAIAGLVLISQSVAMVNTTQRPGNLQGYAVGLPTIAALAWYHRRVAARGSTLDQWVQEAQDFASTDYLSALYQGKRLDLDRESWIVRRLAELTGLPPAFFRENGLAITKNEYRSIGVPGQIMAAPDARFLAKDAASAGTPDAFESLTDPAFDWGVGQLYSPEVRKTAAPYVVRSDVVNDSWSYGEHLSYFSAYDFPGLLNRMLGRYPETRLLVAGGLYDTVASYGGDAFLLNHLRSARPGQITSVHYPAGHMFYTDPASRKQFADAIRALLRR